MLRPLAFAGFVAAAVVALVFVLQDPEPTYGLRAARTCLETQGLRSRYVNDPVESYAFPALEVGPFNYSGIPGHAATVLLFAPSADRAKKSQYVDSVEVPRRGNVLILNDPTRPVIDKCLEAARNDG